MSSRVYGQSIKTAFQVAGVVLSVASIAGCSSLGSGTGGTFGSADPTITGSTGTNGAGDLSQSMPNALGNNSGPYLPPAEVGGASQNDAFFTGAISPVQTAALPPANTTIVNSQALPDLPQSTNVGSQQPMPAQPNVTPLFADNAVPQPASAQAAPNLSVVPEASFQHTIETGESLYAIARRYEVTTDSLIHANSLAAPDQIFVGQKIIIPGRSDLLSARAPQADATTTASIDTNDTPVPVANAPTRTVAQTQGSEQTPTRAASTTQPAVTGADNFRWPVQGRVIVDFAGSRQTGINIEAPEGAAVRAAENGTVIYVGNGVEGYGNLVLVRHSNGYVSAYAHLKDVTVSKDDVIDRGDPLGSVGMSGSVGRPQLHFELRQGASPVDPMPMLAG